MNEEDPMERVFQGAAWHLPAYILTVILVLLFPYWPVLKPVRVIRQDGL